RLLVIRGRYDLHPAPCRDVTHDHRLALDCDRQHKTVVVVGVFADQVDPPRGDRGKLRRSAEPGFKPATGLADLFVQRPGLIRYLGMFWRHSSAPRAEVGRLWYPGALRMGRPRLRITYTFPNSYSTCLLTA